MRRSCTPTAPQQFLGFAEVIYLLQSIKSRVHIIAENTSSTAIVSKENTTNNISDELPDL